MRQLLDAVVSIHQLDIVHMGIDLGNLLVSSERPIHIKLTGFDNSTCGRKIESPVSIPSQPPEHWELRYRASVSPQIWEAILKNQGYVDKRSEPLYSSSIDIWSVGLICSQLTLGKTPSYVDGNQLTDENAVDYVNFLLAAKSGIFTERPETWAQMLRLSSISIPSVLMSFLQKLLNPESESRPKAEDCLSDAWITQKASESTDNAQKSHVHESARKRRKLNPAS